MILDVNVWLTVPFLERISILVELPSSHEERASSEDDFPSEYFAKW